MPNVRIVLNHSGIRELLNSAEIKDDIEERAARIAEAAGPGNEPGLDVYPTRVRSYVVTVTEAAMEAEARDRTLTRAIEAGR